MDYNIKVMHSWNESLVGRLMFVIWNKLQRLQPIIRGLCKNFNGINKYLEDARADLALAQLNLLNDKRNFRLIDKVKKCTKEVLRLINIEEQGLKKKSMVDWLRSGDCNNAYLLASLKSKRCKTQFTSLKNEGGNTLYTQLEFEPEITRYYKNLIGISQSNLTSINIVALRKGPQLKGDQREALIAPIRESELLSSLKGIKYIFASDIDGYNEKFFKSSWDTIK